MLRALSLQADVVNSFSRHLIGGHSISYNLPATAFHIKARVTFAAFSLPITRGFARLSTIMFSFVGPAGKLVTDFAYPQNGAAPTGKDPFKYYIACGSNRTPVFSVDGVAEQYMRTRMALAILERSDGDHLNITPHDYRTNKGIFALNLEKAQGEDPDTGHSGVSSRGGFQLTLELAGAPVGSTIYVCAFHDAICQLGPSGVVLMD